MLALVCQLLGQGAMVYAVSHFSPVVLGIALLSQPAIAALIGWQAFGETLSR
jgi:drug/metabolite transporter (DMT)-like permease